jgi:hypothetical protein
MAVDPQNGSALVASNAKFRLKEVSVMESNAQKGRFSAKLARKAHEAHESGSWKLDGYDKFEDWAKENLGVGRRSVFKFVKIIKYLGHFPDEEIDRVGSDKCDLFACRIEKKESDPGLMAHANDATAKELRRMWNAELRKSGQKVVYGEILEPDFRGLEHAPVSEQGVVFLFGMVSQELGFRVRSIKQRWPDCIAIEKISDSPVRWGDVRIEFEYTSKDFYTHSHSPEATDLIVCWEDNLLVKPDGCPRVLELKSEIEKLPRNVGSL